MLVKNKLIVFFLLISSVFTLVAQEELDALVTINSEKVQSTNKQVFTTLQKSLSEFINQTKWTNKKVLPQERISCSFTIIINAQNNNNFSASLQVQSMRPVYGSSYTSPLLNINDTKFDFKYNEFDPLIFNKNTFDSNLVSTIVFYVYTILGVDADTFKLNGGQEYFKQAEKIMLLAQQSGATGWQNEIGKQNRYSLIDGYLSPKFKKLREIYYNYHRKGFDNFTSDEKKAKQEIQKSVLMLEKLHNITIGNFMLRLFLDAKLDEIVNIFSDGKPTGQEQRVKTVLQKIAPTQGSKWKKIKR